MFLLALRSAAIFVFATLGGAAAARELAPEALDDPALYGGAEVVLLGEVHDNPAHHAAQARALAALRPTAIVWEMLSPEAAARVDPSLDAAALGEALGWAESGWPDFAMYAPLFAAVPEAAHVGAAVPPADLRAAIEGSAFALVQDAARIGLDAPLPPRVQAAEERRQAAAHCDMLPEEMLPGFVEAQRLRDAALALAVLDALEAHGPPVAVIAGNGHAAAPYVPAMLRAAGVVPLAIGQGEGARAPEGFDLWLLAPAPERDDPCAALVRPGGD